MTGTAIRVEVRSDRRKLGKAKCSTSFSFFPGSTDAVPPPTAVLLLAQSEVTNSPAGDGGAGDSFAAAVGARDKTGV